MKRLILMALLLAGCASQPLQPKPATSSSHVLGTLEVSFDSATRKLSASTRGPNLRAQGVIADSAIAFQPLAFQDLDDVANNLRYLSATFSLTNNSGAGLENLSLYAFNQAGQSVAGTAIKNILDFGGNTVPAVAAQRARPTHGTINGTGIEVDPNHADFQVFSNAEAAATQTAALGSTLQSGDKVLEYGFVARNNAGGRGIAAGGAGQITVGIQVPRGTAGTPYRFTMTFVITDESLTRVTRGAYPPETTVSAQNRASAIADRSAQNKEVLLVGSDSDTVSGTNLSGIRFSNAVIATTPVMLLEPDCNIGSVTTTIPQIQGSGLITTATGTVTVDGVVTGDFQNVGPTTNLSGFYLQDRYGDGDAATSDGIFVFGSTFPDVSPGDFIRVTGTPIEFASTANGHNSSLTQLTTPTLVQSCGVRPQPAPVSVSLPVSTAADFERYEGMRISIPTTMTVTEHFQLGRYGQVVLSSDGPSNVAGTDGRIDQYTQFNAPSVSGYAAYLTETAKREIYLDDGRSAQNPDPILFGRGGLPLSATNTLRGGDTVTGLTGILDDRLEGYRIQATGPVNFVASNPRPTTSPDVGASATLRVAGTNVLNYFNTLGTATFTPPNSCAAIAARGASNSAELTRQQDRLKQALLGINADVIGVLEMQNNGNSAGSAIQTVVDMLNAATAPGTYASISAPANGYGCDAIKADVIYKPGKVAVVGSPVSPPEGFGNLAFDANGLVGRKPVAVTFQQLSNGARFTIVVNHFKSKGSSAGGAGDADILDGQGASNGTRVRAAQDLNAWLATNPTGTTDTDYLLVGDFNAYAHEDPITSLESNGFTDLLPPTVYSYAFDGQWGALDHALASGSLAAQVAGATKWHINADEPSVLDYNTEFKIPGQVASLFDGTLPYRASDHDPVVVGLNLNAATGSDFALSATTPTPLSVPAGVGGSFSSTIGINRTNFTDPVTLSLSSPPSGITGSFTPNATTGNASDLTVSVDSSVAAGLYPLTISGTNGTLTQTTTISVTVCGVNSVSISGGTSVLAGNTLPLTATVNRTPAGCGNGGVTWNSNNTAAATIDSSGLVTGVAAGLATITATSVQDGSKVGTLNMTVTAAGAGKMVVSQFQTGGAAGANDEFVELHNVGTASLDLNGYKLVYRSTAGVSDVTMYNFTLSTIIPAGGFYLVKGSVYSGAVVADASSSAAISATGGGIGLRDSMGTLVDSVGFGTATNAFVEAAATSAPAAGVSMIRAANSCQDTNNNLVDFITQNPSTPRNLASSPITCP